MRVTFDTDLSPDRVVAALTDFSARRPSTWAGLDPEKFRVYELAETSALVGEGTASPDIWVKERYDWSGRGQVTWTLEDSNTFRPGTVIQVLASPRDNGGSHIEIDARRIAASPVGYVVVAGLAVFGRRFLLSTYKTVFDRIAATGS
jgi:hypothetical protein